MKKLCIYHGNCADGFTAAWVVRKAFGDDVEFHAGVYGQPLPDGVDGRDVIIVDFSYKRMTMEYLISSAKSVLILDHHKTAQEDLANLCSAEVVFDMNRSGARIAWDYFFPDIEPPKLLLHIEDRDLWRFDLMFTREINANVFSYPYQFEVWDQLMAQDISLAIMSGTAIERKHFKDIAELLALMTRTLTIGGHKVKAANLPYVYSSDAAHTLAQGMPFGACYWDVPDGRVFSLRSTDAGMDVSVVAASYGGGGHRNAAGFRVTFEQARAMELT